MNITDPYASPFTPEMEERAMRLMSEPQHIESKKTAEIAEKVSSIFKDIGYFFARTALQIARAFYFLGVALGIIDNDKVSDFVVRRFFASKTENKEVPSPPNDEEMSEIMSSTPTGSVVSTPPGTPVIVISSPN